MKYLTEQDIINIHDYIIETFSPNEPMGIIHPTSLNETVNSMQQVVYGHILYPTLEDKAAKLFHSLVTKHIFANGNKRTAFLATLTFIALNGEQLTANEEEAEDFTVEIIENDIPVEEVALWIKKHLKYRNIRKRMTTGTWRSNSLLKIKLKPTPFTFDFNNGIRRKRNDKFKSDDE